MYTENLSKVFKYADKYAKDNKFRVKDSRHYLMGLVQIECDAQKYLADIGIDKFTFKLQSDGSGYGTPEIGGEVNEIIAAAEEVCNKLGQKEVGTVHFLLAILYTEKCYAYGAIADYLSARNTTPTEVRERLLAMLSAHGKITQQQDVRPALVKTAQSVAVMQTGGNGKIPYGTDITQKAEEGRFDPVIGRETEIMRMIQILSRRSKNNPVLVGEPGVGKSAVVEGLAQAIVSGDVPQNLAGKRIAELDIAGMVAGTRYRGDFEERFKLALNKVAESGNTILFIDEIHNIVGTGSTADGSMDAAEILKPVLARGELQVIGATTLDEYHKYIENDPALERRFQPVTVGEPTEQQAIAILTGVKDKYEQHHKVIITPDAISAAVKLSTRYITDRYLPDKAFDLIDEACSKVKISAFAMPEPLARAYRQFTAVKKRRDELTSDSSLKNYAEITREYDEARELYEQLSQRYNFDSQVKTPHITAVDVAAVVSQWTGIPVSQISQSEKERLLNLESTLAQRVIGQKDAVKAVSLAIRRQRAGLKDPNKPIGSFIFVGPTGVGKTELTKALAECLFGSDTDIVRLDMSEYMEKQSTSKLIGAPPGYSGFEESGQLTEKIRRKPYSVVLFDEIEKAHVDVFNLLLQILDEGRLTDSHGKTVDFRNTVIIMTSNIGADSRNCGTDNIQKLEENISQSLRRHFRPEFLNRVDEIIVFKPLTEDEAREIAKLLCQSLVKRLKGTVTLKFTTRAIDYLARIGYDSEYGARPLKRTLQRKVEDALAERLLSGQICEGETVTVDAINDEIKFFIE
ncbi:MAG: ATP-dependent Clp protease ATP-binding subunit [Corallococcus sp.]|nr:ATP-dependent Clp protease ATP-binding subunit [Corallococcus sp.]